MRATACMAQNSIVSAPEMLMRQAGYKPQHWEIMFGISYLVLRFDNPARQKNKSEPIR